METCKRCGSSECRVADAEQLLDEERRKSGRDHDWEMVAFARGFVNEAKAECDARIKERAHGA